MIGHAADLTSKMIFVRRRPVYFINLFATNSRKLCSHTITPINMCCYCRLCIKKEMLNIADKIFHNSDHSVRRDVVSMITTLTGFVEAGHNKQCIYIGSRRFLWPSVSYKITASLWRRCFYGKSEVKDFMFNVVLCMLRSLPGDEHKSTKVIYGRVGCDTMCYRHALVSPCQILSSPITSNILTTEVALTDGRNTDIHSIYHPSHLSFFNLISLGVWNILVLLDNNE